MTTDIDTLTTLIFRRIPLNVEHNEYNIHFIVPRGFMCIHPVRNNGSPIKNIDVETNDIVDIIEEIKLLSVQWNIFRDLTINISTDKIRTITPTNILRNIINTTNSRGQTPLFIAVRYKNIDHIKFLLDAGADITIRNTDGSTIFHGLAWDNKTDETSFYKFLMVFCNLFSTLDDLKKIYEVLNIQKNDDERSVYEMFKK